MSKVVSGLREAIELCGLKDGMSVSFHHALRNGDYVVNMVMEQLAGMGLRHLTLKASSIFPVHAPLVDHIRSGVISRIETDYMSGPVAAAISEGIMEEPVLFQSHGGRADRLAEEDHRADVAFVAASASDCMGNCSGRFGKSTFGSMGYAFADAMYARKVVVVTDDLRDYPLYDFSIAENYVDYVVCVPEIGDPTQISSGTTKMTKDPIAHRMAQMASQVIEATGLLKDGFNFQTGAGGATLATAKYLKELMQKKGIAGGCCIGGMTGYLTQMLKEGYFRSLLDVQCFDLEAVASLNSDAGHREITAMHYASAKAKSSAVDSLDVVVLGATQIDTDFNVNVHTDSLGKIMGGSGGHCDAAAGARTTIILAPLVRHRIPIVVDKVTCVSTPGSTVDILITQYGTAVNPLRQDLIGQLSEHGIRLYDVHELREMAESISGRPAAVAHGSRVVADVLYRDGRHLDSIYACLK